MSNVLAIVSKAVFEKQAKGAAVGTTVALDHYASSHAALAPLEAGGALFLVTVRPPDEQLWLVGVLESPRKADDGWRATTNVVPIVDLTACKGELVFANGKGLSAKSGALGMSLQTPRALADSDVVLLREATGGKANAKAAKPAPNESVVTKVAKAAKQAPNERASTQAAKQPVKADKAPRASAKPAASPAAGLTGKPAVEAALATGDGAQALTAALAWWTETRAPAVADLVDAISTRVSPPTVADDHEFTKVARGKDPLDLGALLAAIPELAASFLPTAGELLASFPDDPRLARAVATWALDPITTSSSTYPFWTNVLEAMARTRDVRVVALLKKRIAKKPGDSQFWPKFYAALTRAIAKLGDAPADVSVPAALTKQVASLSPVGEHDGSATTPSRIEAEPVPAVSGSPLEQAVQHLAAGRINAAIAALLEHWRATRAPALADVIDRATRLLPTYDLPLLGRIAPNADPWLAIFERDPLAALPQLLQSINVYDGPYGAKKLADRRLMELANLPDDPRVALRLAELVSIFGVSPQRTQYWKSLLEQIARIADVRTCEPLGVAFRDFTNKYFDHHRQAKRIIRDFVMQPPSVAPLPAADRALIGELSRTLDQAEAKSLARTLVAAVAADWTDDGPRLVYADWLSEREHPRGEAIVLECKRGRTQAEDTRLTELRGSAYLYGAVHDLGGLKPEHCDRGIPVHLVLGWGAGTLNWRALASHPLVALIETVDVGEVQQPPTADDLAAFVKNATRLQAIERAEEDGERVLWSFADAALPGFRRERGRLVRR